MKSLSSFSSDGQLFKRPRLDGVEQPSEIILPTDIWSQVFYDLLSGDQNAGACLSILHSVCKSWGRGCSSVKVRLCLELPFECIVHLPRLKTLNSIAFENTDMFKKILDEEGGYDGDVNNMLQDYKFIDRLPLNCIKFLDEHGSKISALKLNSTLCGKVMDEFQKRLPRLEILILENVSNSSYASIGKMTQLKRLTVDGKAAGVEAFENICFLPNLEKLVFKDLTEADFSFISKLTHLKTLHLLRVQGDWLPKILKLQGLEELEVKGSCPRSWDRISHLTNLTSLTYRGWDDFPFLKIHEEDLPVICKLPNLKTLNSVDYFLEGKYLEEAQRGNNPITQAEREINLGEDAQRETHLIQETWIENYIMENNLIEQARRKDDRIEQAWVENNLTEQALIVNKLREKIRIKANRTRGK